MQPCELEQQGPIRLEEFLILAENDPENRYELIDGRLSPMEKGSPDHSIIGANIGCIFVQGEMVELSRSGIHFLVDEVYEDTTFDNSFSEEG